MRIQIKDLFIVALLNFLFIVGFSYISKYYSLPYFILPIILLVALLFLFKALFKDKIMDYGFKKFSFSDFKNAIYMLIFIMPIAFLARLIAPGFDVFYANLTGLNTFLSFTIFNLILIPFVIKEELVERIIQNKLSKAYGSVVSILFLSVNFGIVHYMLANMFYGIVSVVGIALGIIMVAALYEKTKNLFLAFFVHFVYDVLIIYQIYLHIYQPVLEWVFWGILLALFLLVFKKGWKFLKSAFMVRKYRKLDFLDWVFLVIFVVWPILLFIF